MNQSSYHICRPKTQAHKSGMKWFESLSRILNDSDGPKDMSCMSHSIQFYSLFVETGEERYLEMCEDFLKYAVKPE